MNKHLLLTLLALFLAGHCTVADLRPLKMQDQGVTDIDKQKGKLLLEQMVVAMYDALKPSARISAVKLTLRDEWPAFFSRNFSMPWQDSPTQLELQTRGFGKKLQLQAPEKEFLIQELGKAPEGQDRQVSLFMRLLWQFMFFAEYAQRFELQAYAGSAAAIGNGYELVLLTTGSFKASNEHDQYLLWINQQSHTLDFIQYTMREHNPSLYGTMHLTDYRKINGIIIPHRHSLMNYPGSKNIIRDTRILSFELLQEK